MLTYTGSGVEPCGRQPCGRRANLVTLQERHFPAPRPEFPARSPGNAGATVALPAPEASALIAAGYATAAGGSAIQSSVGVY